MKTLAKSSDSIVFLGATMLETLQLIGKHDLQQNLIKPLENQLSSDCGDLAINGTQQASTAGQDQ